MATHRLNVYFTQALSDLQIKAVYVWLETVSAHVEQRRPFSRRNQAHHDYVRDQRELLLLQLALWASETGDPKLADEIDQLAQTIRQKRHDFWLIKVSDGRQFDIEPITNALRSFSVDLQAYAPLKWDDSRTSSDELSELNRLLGAVPKHQIELNALEEKIEDQVLLASMAADLAQQFNGRVRLQLRPQLHTVRGLAQWSLADTHQLARELYGQIWDVPFGNGTQVYQLLDADAVRSWVEHPRFYI